MELLRLRTAKIFQSATEARGVTKGQAVKAMTQFCDRRFSHPD
jgi:hypothetical protein